jgi:hypothetical protein
MVEWKSLKSDVRGLKMFRVDDFIWFCEYAYCGDYMVLLWEELPLRLSSASEKVQQNNDDDSWGFGVSPRKKKKSKMAYSVSNSPYYCTVEAKC